MTERPQRLCIAHAVHGRAAFLRQRMDEEAASVRKRITDCKSKQQCKQPDRADNPPDAVQTGLSCIGTAGNNDGQSGLTGGAAGYQYVSAADLILGKVLAVSGVGQQLVNRFSVP